MRSRKAFLYLILALLTLAGSAGNTCATTIVVPKDEELVVSARAIVEGRVISTETAFDDQRGMVFTYVTISIGDVLKGPFYTGQEIVIKEMGGVVGDVGTRIYGSPAYREGEQVLLYLGTWLDGSLRTHDMLLGKFRVFDDGARRAVERARDEDGVRILSGSSSEQFSKKVTLKSYKRMIRRVLNEEAGRVLEHERRYYGSTPMLPVPEGWQPTRRAGDVQPRFTFLGNPPIRWFESSVTFSNFPDGEPEGGGADIAAAIGAWNAVPGIGINVSFGGTAPGCGNLPGGGNVVTWNNCGGWFAPESCARILALGGFLRFNQGQQTTVNGVTFIKAEQGFFALNPYASCFFDDHCNVREIATHELGHALGLGHSQFQDATMAPFAHFDGRCASVRQDDMDGIVFIYPSGGGGGGSPLRITTTSIPNAQVGVAYEVTFRAEGGIPPYNWNKVGLLPSGLTLNAGGIIRGTPTQVEAKTFTITVTDSRGTRVEKEFTINVTNSGGGGGGLQITTTGLPDVQRSSGYSFTLAATGGATPYTWSLASGQLPGGITLNASQGRLSGTPTQAGTFNFTARVTDSASASADRALTLTVTSGGGGGGGPVQITTATLPDGRRNSAYSQTLQATGGSPPYTWRLRDGSLPPGLQLIDSGRIEGTPAETGTFNFRLRAIDSVGAHDTRDFSIVINQPDATPALRITTTSVPAGQRGSPYSTALLATGGATPYAWSLAAGQLPSGLAINASGQIQGTPQAAGSFTFTARVTDSASASAQHQFTMTVADSGGGGSALRIVTDFLPDGIVNEPYIGQYVGDGGTPPYRWRVSMGTFPPGLSFSSAGAITGTPTQPGQFTFTINLQDAAGGSVSKFWVLDVYATAVRILNTNLPRGQKGAPYSVRFGAQGGRDPYFWSIVQGAPPTGLSMNTDGLLSGTPTAEGDFRFTVKVNDSSGLSDQKEFVLGVGAGGGSIIMWTSSVPQGQVGVRYSAQLTVSGGSPPYTWSLAAGQPMPAGLSLGADGQIQGTPQAAGEFPVTIGVADSRGTRAAREIVLNIAGGGAFRIVSTSPLERARVRAPYSLRLTATGGVVPYQWVLSDGFLPMGLELDRMTGELAGTPEETGAFRFTVTAFDGQFTRLDKVFELAVEDSSGAGVGFITTSLPDGALGMDYSAALKAEGGSPPYQFVILEGRLPDGLDLDTATGLISGKPTAAGDFTFTASVVDKAGVRGARAFAITIKAEADPNSPVITKVKLKLKKGGEVTVMTIIGTGFGGEARVYLDQEAPSKPILTERGQRITFKRAGLPRGLHTIVVENSLGRRSSPFSVNIP